MALEAKSTLINKANSLIANNQFLAATHIYEQICNLDKTDAGVWFKLGELYWHLSRRQDSARCYQRSVALEPHDAYSHLRLGIALHALGIFPEALKSFKQSLNLNPGLPETYFHLGNLFKDQSIFDKAEEMYRRSLRLNPEQALAHCYLGNMLEKRSLVEDAIASYDKALTLNPELGPAKWGRLRILPIIYESTAELEKYRQRYAEGLRLLDEQLALGNYEQQAAALWGVAGSTSFLLQYQGRDDLLLQQQFGKLVERIMAASFPKWSKQVAMPPLGEGERIRVGYASSYLCAHNGAIWLLGWLRHRDQSRFEVFCYHTGTQLDDKTKEFMALSDHFYHIPNSLEQPCEQIAADHLHVLVYPELGMYAPTQLMAGLHLAPVQCTSWGHPITSGFSTVDYYLSSDLMEPENGQQHYTETLVRIPNIAICYSRNQSESFKNQPIEKQRSDFCLREDAIMYFCSQSLFKYLPEYDYLFPAIAKRVPNAQFAFITVLNKDVEGKFMKRLRLAFHAAGLDADDYCVMLPRLSQEDYLTMNHLADVFLDNPSWSGANTTLTAIDCDLPVVTWPTIFMRGRHSYAILKMMGITETIAGSAEEYVGAAAQLGVDDKWRLSVVKKIRELKYKLYDDTNCVRGLEAFYEEAVRSRLAYGD